MWKMCRCCQSCWEDCYWYCIEEKFCFDKNIANYNADEDEYFAKKRSPSADLSDGPICEQPGRQENTHISSKIREEDYRQIQTNVPFLAPEILAVFANSQIFHDNQPTKSLAIVHKSPAVIDEKKNSREIDSEKKLLKRLEGTDLNDDDDDGGDDVENTERSTKTNKSFQEKNNEAVAAELILRPVPTIKMSSADNEYNDANEQRYLSGKTPILNKRLRNIQDIPYFSFRPASENDIFTIAGTSQISMTPEIPSISYSTLPKNYEDTPSIDKYKEAVSLHSIQTSNAERANEFDFSMPRYFGKADMIVHSADNLTKTGPKKVEKSKRLKLLRANLPPLSIHINKEKSKERNIE